MIGQAINHVGYSFDRTHRFPRCNTNLLRLAVLLALAGARNTAANANGASNAKKTLNVVQIGAYDGKVSDPVDGLLELPNIRAIIVEPQQVPFQMLLDRYIGVASIALESSMIGPVDGKYPLYLPMNADQSQLATSDRLHLHKLGYDDAQIRRVLVDTLTVKSLLDKHGVESVDVLQIDAEGADFEILKQFIALGVEPRIVNMETYHLTAADRSGLHELLGQRGYTFVDYNLDTLFLKTSLLQL